METQFEDHTLEDAEYEWKRDRAVACPKCEGYNVERRRTVKILNIRGVEVKIDTPLHHCLDCNEEFWVSGIDPDFMATALSTARS